MFLKCSKGYTPYMNWFGRIWWTGGALSVNLGIIALGSTYGWPGVAPETFIRPFWF